MIVDAEHDFDKTKESVCEKQGGLLKLNCRLLIKFICQTFDFISTLNYLGFSVSMTTNTLDQNSIFFYASETLCNLLVSQASVPTLSRLVNL